MKKKKTRTKIGARRPIDARLPGEIDPKMPATHPFGRDASSPSSLPCELCIGTVMKDGTVYAGISPETAREMYTMPANVPKPMRFREAVAYAAAVEAHGHKDWRVPTKTELNVLFGNQEAIGGFNFPDLPTWYWSSSSRCEWSAWGQRFTDGRQDYGYDGLYSSVRLVRSGRLRK